MQFPVFTFKPSTQKYIQLIFIYIEDIIWRNRQSVTNITHKQLIFIYIDLPDLGITRKDSRSICQDFKNTKGDFSKIC